MYLKAIEIQGFKSFADKTLLEFNSGITSVIGPNGSGKSNISDAVRWVLGEQSAKTLRGGKMEDVIFAGTEHRKPMGFAEVSLMIDNSDNALPVEYSEVTISRRIYRSGESEYLINKTSCRLKDIHELFFDTGLGKDGYSIIGQGRVDEILSSRSEDRRHIFEEASGIMKYKVRKLEAEKKLEMTEQNLTRINDIINELENQLEPLKKQSETARKYLSLRDSLKELEVNVYIENIARYKEKIKEYEEQYSLIRTNIDEENNKLEYITRENQQKTELLKTLEEKLDVSKQRYYDIENSLEKCNSEIKLNDERINNLVQNIERIDNEISEIDEKLDNFEKEEKSKRVKLSYLQGKKEEYSQKLSEYERQLETLMALLDESERHIELLKGGIMDKLDLMSDKKTQINNVKNHIDGLKRRQNSIDNEIYHIVLEKDRDNIKKEDLTISISKVDNEIKQSLLKLEKFNIEKSELESTLDAKRKKQNAIKSDLHVKTSRSKMLQDMERNLEGYNRSVKELLNACQRSPEFGAGIYGALAQLLTVDKKYETAVEMSLGGALQNIVTSTEEDAKRAIEYLKKNRIGRATFLPVSSVKGRFFDSVTAEQVRSMEGFCGIASELVSCDGKYREIVLNLLGKVVVVQNLDAGIKIARRFGYSFKIVTLEGDILNTGGSMSGGSTDSRSGGILSRNREIVEIKEEIELLKREETAVDADIIKIIAMLEEVMGEVKEEEDRIRSNELLKVREESQLSQVEENIKRAGAKVEMLKEEKNQLKRQEETTALELQKYNEDLIAIEKDISQTKEIISQHQEKHKEGQAERDNLHSDITDFKISVNSIVESMQTVNEAIEKVLKDKEDLSGGIARKTREKDRSQGEIKSLNEKNEGLRLLVKKYNEEKSGRTFEIDRISEERKVIEEELAGTLDNIKNINKNIVLLQEEFNRIEVKRAKADAEMGAIQNRLWDEYELTYTNALQYKKEIDSMAQAQKAINEYKNQIRDLGPVNVAAIDEYVKTKERFEFMSLQRDDMEQAKEKLNKVIHEITTQMKQRFMEQFKLINENFNIVFRELFEGGRAGLVLLDEQNVLESGIEIEVQPPGKKLQNMMLLSGGERAFTAIALLFSILKLSPTPFCILDEIEAALDDANVFRFAQYLRKFADSTQFIVVTHRKGTMESSDTLYGVTMQEHGISKVVSLKLGDKAS